MRRLELIEQICTGALELAAGLWFFAFGATIGSFLNVVAYRVPRGESVIWRSSHCPRCQAGIRPRDNIPVLSWFILRGRCRTCRQTISPRYPAVELLAGLMFLSLACVEFLPGGGSAGGMGSGGFAGAVRRTMMEGEWQVAQSYALHCLLLSVLFGCTLIKLDGHSLPKGAIVAAAAAGLAALRLWPDIWRPAPDFARPANCWEQTLPAAAAARGVSGLAAGTVLGAAAGVGQTIAFRGRRAIAGAGGQLAIGLALIGLYLGWPGVLSAGALAAVGMVLAACWSRRWPALGTLPAMGHLLLGAFAHLCLWRLLYGFTWWPGPNASWGAMAIAGVVVAVAPAAAAWAASAAPCTTGRRRPP
jgi:leader peptidase (prepilin peptidase)/N-methyltransferase